MSSKDNCLLIKSLLIDNREVNLATVIETQDMEEIVMTEEAEEVIRSSVEEGSIIVTQMTQEVIIVVIEMGWILVVKVSERDHLHLDAIAVLTKVRHLENLTGVILTVHLIKSSIEEPVRDQLTENLIGKREATLLEKSEYANNHNSQEKFPIDPQSIILIKICPILYASYISFLSLQYDLKNCKVF